MVAVESPSEGQSPTVADWPLFMLSLWSPKADVFAVAQGVAVVKSTSCCGVQSMEPYRRETPPWRHGGPKDDEANRDAGVRGSVFNADAVESDAGVRGSVFNADSVEGDAGVHKSLFNADAVEERQNGVVVHVGDPTGSNGCSDISVKAVLMQSPESFMAVVMSAVGCCGR